MANDEVLAAIRASLGSLRDPVRGAAAQAYLKSSMPSLGVRGPEVRRIAKTAAANHPFVSAVELRATVLELWRGAEFREERYAAIDLTVLRMAAGDVRMLPLYEDMGDKEFFIRKAIGWSLREYAKVDPDWVRDFVEHHNRSLSPLSRREALKNLRSDDGTGGDRLV